MISIDDYQLVDLEASKAPLWLLRPVRYSEGPAFLCEVSGVRSMISFDRGNRLAFNVIKAPTNGPWLVAADARLDADPKTIASPFEGDIPLGAICIIDEIPCLSARYNHGQIYISLRTGEPVPENYNRFVAFTNWRLTVAGADDDRVEIYSSVAVEG